MYEFRVVQRNRGSDNEDLVWGGDSLALQILYPGDTQFEDWLYVGRPIVRTIYEAMGAFLAKEAHGS